MQVQRAALKPKMDMTKNVTSTNGMSMPMDMDMMKMYFHLGYNEKHFIFNEWNIKSIGDLFGSILAFFVFAILYEGLKAFRETVKVKELKGRRHLSTNAHSHTKYETQPLVDHVSFMRPAFFGQLRLIQAMLHVLQMFMGYILMLAFMAYNVWICIGILLGGGFGHLLFTWLVDTPLSDSSDHCL